MRTSIATVSMSGTLEEKLEAASLAGFDGVEIFDQDLLSSDASPAEIRRRADDLGLKIEMLQPLRDIEAVDPEQFRRSLARAAFKFKTAAVLGAPVVLMCSNVATASIDDSDLMAEQLHEVGKLAADEGIRVAYEALAWGTFVSDHRRAWQIAAAADHPQIGTCLDSFHILSLGHTLDPDTALPRDRLFYVQIADAPRLQMDVLSWSRHHRVFPGQGDFDLAAFVAATLELGYRGPLSIEVFNDVFRQTPAVRTARSAVRSLRYLEDSVARRFGHFEDTVRLLPAPEAPSAIDFIELGRSEPRITNVLTELGFERTGAHRRKPVELWTAGDARFVFGSEETVTNRPFRAIGFEVEDPAAAAARAEALRVPYIDRDTEPGEVELFAVRSVDAADVYIAPGGETVPAWTNEFGAAPTSPLHVVGIDHITIDQPWTSHDDAVLYYRALLGLEPENAVDVADPRGLVRSQVLSNTARSVRLVLNMTPPLVQARGGSEATSHIALTCNDLVGLVEQLATRGVELLGVPDNYYDDLASRVDLEGETVQRLRRANVLYDMDGEGGEFFQAYLAPVAGFFIELVERRGSYSGFGAMNAPIRRAAQERATHHSGGRRPVGVA